MNMIKQRRACILIIFQTLLCCIKGLLLYPASDLTAQSFILVCDLQGTTWTNTILFNYNGTIGGACGSPPNPTCSSSIGTISYDSQIVNFTLNQNEIMRKGNALWDCIHGTDPAYLNTTIIALCTNIEVKYADKKMDISCSCGFPSVQAELEYKDGQNGKTLGSQTFDLSSSPGTNCTTDTRAKDYSSKIASFPSGTVEVCATIMTYSQITTPKTKCELVPGCNYSDTELFLGGFSCSLIVLITTIIMLIILGCKILPEIFGDLSTKKKTIIIIIVVFIVVALIIGLALGFGLKECNQRNLGLGLGLGLGFLLAIVLVVTLFVYHKQRDSKKGYEI